MTSQADRLTTPRLRSRPLVESREQPLPCRAVEQSRDLKAVAGLIGPDRRLRLWRKDARDRPQVEPIRAQVLLRDLDVARGQKMICRRLHARRLLGLRGDTPGHHHHYEPPEGLYSESSHPMVLPLNPPMITPQTLSLGPHVTAWFPPFPIQQRRALQPRNACMRSKRKRYCVQRQPPGTTHPGVVTRMPAGWAQTWARTV
jgi:hypothetical protein